MKKSDCWMTFTEALEQYLDAREDTYRLVGGSRRHLEAEEKLEEAAEHLNALTGE